MPKQKQSPVFEAAAFLARLRADGWWFRLLGEVGSAKGYQIFYRSVNSYTKAQDARVEAQIKANRNAIIVYLLEEGRVRNAAQNVALEQEALMVMGLLRDIKPEAA